jgi:Lrp/AsnC family transcriptional regulator for asnA, asnC and gidA
MIDTGPCGLTPQGPMISLVVMKKEDADIPITPSDYRIDNLDRQILACLIEDANRPYTDIAQQLIVSHGTIHVRMKKLREVGIVQGAHLAVNVRKLGFDITAFVGVLLDKASEYSDVMVQLKDVPEIVEAHHITGAYSLLLKVTCRDSGHLLQVLKERLQTLDGISRTETFLVLEEIIRQPTLID